MMIAEENYLEHYGRKGMKWYENIFTKDKKSKAEKTYQKKQIPKLEIN